MLDAALKIISKDPDGFFAVVEEEGTDNFGNNNNAAGTIEAVRRADAAIGVAMNYVDNQDPNTLVITAADSDAGGLQVFQYTPYSRPSGNITSEPELADSEPSVPFINVNPTTSNTTRNFLDGEKGSTASLEYPWIPFSAQDSIDGPMGNFGIGWVGTPDFPGSIVSKAYGMNSDKLPSTLDNTEIYALMYETLFGVAPEVAAAQRETQLISGTPGDDFLFAGAPDSQFDGINDIVFLGSGNDEVDLRLVVSPIAGNNRIDLGSGDDVIFLNKNDRVFGGSGDDIFDAAYGQGGNRISGGAGDDIFFLGSGDRILGDHGNDQFYVQSGGDNQISGGEGQDQFWIVSNELPQSANTILDFEIGRDVIGILGSTGLGISADTLSLNVLNGNTEIAFGDHTLAILNGVTGIDTNTSFVFAW